MYITQSFGWPRMYLYIVFPFPSPDDVSKNPLKQVTGAGKEGAPPHTEGPAGPGRGRE